MIESSNHTSQEPIPGRFAGQRGTSVRGLIAAAALLMPLMAAAGSQIDSGVAANSLDATAHLNFKIVIPKVLFLHVAGENDRSAGAPTASVMSTGRDVTVNTRVLTAAARKPIAQDVPCTRGGSDAAPVICTASMP